MWSNVSVESPQAVAIIVGKPGNQESAESSLNACCILACMNLAPKSVLQPRLPTGRSESGTCNIPMSRTSIDAYKQFEFFFVELDLEFGVTGGRGAVFLYVFLM